MTRAGGPPMALNLASVKRSIRRAAALMNSEAPGGLGLSNLPKQSTPRGGRYPSLAFTKSCDTVTPPQDSGQNRGGIHRIPGIGTYTSGNNHSLDHNEYLDTSRELSDIRRNEIPKNHNTPTNERESIWDKDQRKALYNEAMLRKEPRGFQKVSRSHHGVVKKSDIESFDYTNVQNSHKEARKNDGFFLPKISDKQNTGQISDISPRTDVYNAEKLKTPRKLGKVSKEKNLSDETNPDVLRLGFKEAFGQSERKRKTTKVKKNKKIGTEPEVEGHLRYQTGVLQPKQSHKEPLRREKVDTIVIDTEDGEDGYERSEEIEYCDCDTSAIESLVCTECNSEGGLHLVRCSKWQEIIDGCIDCEICSRPRKTIIATRFVTAAQAEVKNNITADRYLARLNEKFDRGDYDWNDDVPDVNEVNTKLQVNDNGGLNEDQQGAFEDVMEEEYPSHRIDQNGLIIYPDGAKEAYLKALEAAQIAKLNAFISLEKRISRPFVFSYFENIPRKQNSGTAVCGYIVDRSKSKAIKLKGKQAEMKHIFGNIDTNDYYPGQKKNPVRKKILRKPMVLESSYLTTDRSTVNDSLSNHLKTESLNRV